MDYVVGSVAALVSGNVTPNRPKFMKRALTPIKHQPSPNVTPKSEFVDDRSIFLSPTLQKKKAIVKKSPKRIFENSDLDVTNDGEGNVKSPKADKVKKHLKDELEADSNAISPKSPKNKKKLKELSQETNESILDSEAITSENPKAQNERTPKKKKRKQSHEADDSADDHITEHDLSNIKASDPNNYNISSNIKINKYKGQISPSPKKMKSLENKSIVEYDRVESKDEDTLNLIEKSKISLTSPKKKNKLNKPRDDTNAEELNNEQKSDINLTLSSITKSKGKKKKLKLQSENIENEDNNNKENDISNNSKEKDVQNIKNKNKKLKKKSKSQNNIKEETGVEVDSNTNISKKKRKSKTFVNPNAITNEDSASEHDSDNDIESENEDNNKEVLDTGPAEASSDEEEKPPKKQASKQEKVQKDKEVTVNTEEEVRRTLFVGNVPFSAKCKKELKKIFSKYGQIETVRIRTVPVKDGRMTPKLAVIKNELHPDRSTVNVYIKFRDASSVNEALVENGTVLNNHHLRVTRSDCTGSEHDPKCTVFVGNLPFAMDDESLLQKFQRCGEIVSVRIVRDRKTNAGKGFGYVNFKTKDAVELALALSDEDLTIKNRIIRVKRCTQMTHKQKFQQDSSRGNRHGSYGGGNPMDRSRFGNRTGSGAVGRAGHDRKVDGAMRRVMNKRKHQDGGGEGPPRKRERNINQPNKKVRKEFVGMTAEKRKKNKFNKGQKKKKALSEILTK